MQKADAGNDEELAHFRCPISLELMKDPGMALTGITYDRESVERWLVRGWAAKPPHPLTLYPPWLRS